MSVLLIYKGGGGIPNVPARDITTADVKRFNLNIDKLAASPLYEKPAPPKKKEKKEVKDG